MYETSLKMKSLKKILPKIILYALHHKSLLMSIGIFLFISLSTILTLDQVQQRQINQSQAQASADIQPGGACDLTVNKGCGGLGGCRHWEKCSPTFTCIDTTNGGDRPASADACGDSAFISVQSNPSPQPTQGNVPTSIPAQQPSIYCADMRWYCLGECATQGVRDLFGGNDVRWRTEAAQNKNQPGACDTISSQPGIQAATQAPTQQATAPGVQSTPVPVQYSTTSCYVGTNPYPAGYCSPTSAGSPYLYCNNTAGATPSSSTSTYIGWIQDQSSICIEGRNMCIGNGFVPSGGFPCCTGKTDSQGKCSTQSGLGENPTVPPASTATYTPVPPSTHTPTLTNTQTPSKTSTLAPTYTPVPVTSGPTNTSMPLPTSTYTPTPTTTFTPTPSPTRVPTNTLAPTAIPPTPTQVLPTPTNAPPTATLTPPIATNTLAPPDSSDILCLPTIDGLIDMVRIYQRIHPNLRIRLAVNEGSPLQEKFRNGYDKYFTSRSDVLVKNYEVSSDPVPPFASVSFDKECLGSEFCQKWFVNKWDDGSCEKLADTAYSNVFKHELIHNKQFLNDPNTRVHQGSDNNLARFTKLLREGIAYTRGSNFTFYETDIPRDFVHQSLLLYHLLDDWSSVSSGNKFLFSSASLGNWDNFCIVREAWEKSNQNTQYPTFNALLNYVTGTQYPIDASDLLTLEECLNYTNFLED
ncbi:hypothetical protein KBD81_06255 [Candidatus Woesebacteria bacterium]|nr:hypothetical protein [Candidatus Woesebacteria bacterium]